MHLEDDIKLLVAMYLLYNMTSEVAFNGQALHYEVDSLYIVCELRASILPA
jgi:hypothetical protein